MRNKVYEYEIRNTKYKMHEDIMWQHQYCMPPTAKAGMQSLPDSNEIQTFPKLRSYCFCGTFPNQGVMVMYFFSSNKSNVSLKS